MTGTMAFDPSTGRPLARLKTPGLRIALREHAGLRSLVVSRRDRSRPWAVLHLFETPDGFRCGELDPGKADDRPAWLRRMRPERRNTWEWDGWTRLLAETGIHPDRPGPAGSEPIRAFLREALGPEGGHTLARLAWVSCKTMGHLIGERKADTAVRRLMDLAPCFADLAREELFVGSEGGTYVVGWHWIGVFDVSDSGLAVTREVPEWLAAMPHSNLPGHPFDLRILRLSLAIGNEAPPTSPSEWDAFCRLVVACSEAFPEAWEQAELSDLEAARTSRASWAEWAVFARAGIPHGGGWASRMAAFDAMGGSPRDHHSMATALLLDLLLPLSMEPTDPRSLREPTASKHVTHAAFSKAVALLGTGDSLETALSAAASWVEAGRPGYATLRHGYSVVPSREAAYARWSRFLVDPGRGIDGFLLTSGFRAFRECLGDWGR